MIEHWIDPLAEVWEFAGPGFDAVKSYRLIERAEFPSAINPVDLAQHPIALTIPASIQPMYSKGHKHLTWYGATEFHVAPDLNKGRLPSLLPWYGLILRAAASNVQLSDQASFVIIDRPDGIVGPIELKYGDESPHWGFIVQWMVNEVPTNTDLPVSA